MYIFLESTVHWIIGDLKSFSNLTNKSSNLCALLAEVQVIFRLWSDFPSSVDKATYALEYALV